MNCINALWLSHKQRRHICWIYFIQFSWRVCVRPECKINSMCPHLITQTPTIHPTRVYVRDANQRSARIPAKKHLNISSHLFIFFLECIISLVVIPRAVRNNIKRAAQFQKYKERQHSSLSLLSSVFVTGLWMWRFAETKKQTNIKQLYKGLVKTVQELMKKCVLVLLVCA